MKRFLLASITAPLLASLLAGAAGAVQLNIMLQGYLTNTAGTPYTTPQTAEFKLYQGGDAQAAGSGTLAYHETGEVTPSASGVFSYLLGSGSPLTAALSTSTFDTSKTLFVEISVGGSVLLPRLQLTGLPYAAIAGVAESLKPVAQLTTGVLTASSGTFSGPLTASIANFTATGSTQPSVSTSSGIVVTAGGVTAPFFSGVFYGSGAGLTGVAASNVSAGSVTPGTLGAGVVVPAANLAGGPIASSLLPANVAYTTANNTFEGPQSIAGGLTASSATLTAAGGSQYSLTTASGVMVGAGGVTAPFFAGSFIGNGSGLSGVAASNVAAPNVGPGTLGSGVLVPTTLLTGAPIPAQLLPSTVAYTGAANTFTAPQNLPAGLTASSATLTASGSGQFSLATSSGISVAGGGVTAPYFSGAFYGDGKGLSGVSAAKVAAADVVPGTLANGVILPANARIGGAYPGPTTGYTGVGQETSRNQLVFPSWSNVAPDTFGVKLIGVNKTAYPTAPWYLAQTSELHIGLLAKGALDADDTVDLFQFTPAGFVAAGSVTASSGSFADSVTAASAILTGTGSGRYSLTTSSGINVQAGVVNAPAFNGTYFGDGSRLTGVGAASVAASSITPGILGPGVQLPASGLVNGPIASSILPSTVAYTSISNAYSAPQVFSAGLTANAGAFNSIAAGPAAFTATGQYSLTTSSGISVAGGGVTAPFFSGMHFGDGSKLTGVGAASVSAGNVSPGILGPGVEVPAGSLVNGPLSASMLPPSVAYTGSANTFVPAQAFPGGLTAGTASIANSFTAATALLTATGQYSLSTSSGISVASGGVNAPFFAGAFLGDGSKLSGVTAAGVAASGVAPGTLGAGVQLSAASLINGPIAASMLPPTVAYTSAPNAFLPAQTFLGGLAAASAAVDGSLTAASATFTATGAAQYSLTTSSGINVKGGGVSAPYFTGSFIGDGTKLSGVVAAGVAAAGVAAGTLATGVQVPAANLVNGPLTTSLLPPTVAYTTASNSFGPAQTFPGGISASSGSFNTVSAAAGAFTATGQYSLTASSGINVAAGGVAAPYFTGAHFGSGAGLTGVTAANVAASNVSPGTLGAGVLVPTTQLAGPPIAAALLPSTVAYTTAANTWTAPQTVAAPFTIAPAGSGAVQRVGGVYSGPTSGYSGIGQETSRNQIVFPSWSNVVPDTLGVKLMAINKTAYATFPWYFAQTSELHISLLPQGALSGDDTADLFQFTPSGLSITGGLTATSGAFAAGVRASSLTLTAFGSNQYSLSSASGIYVAAGGVTAPFLSGAHYGSGAGLSGVTAASVAAPNVTAGTLGAGVQLPAAGVAPGTLGAGVLMPTGNLTGGPIPPSLLPTTAAYTSVNNNFSASQTIAGGLTAQTGAFTATGTQPSLTTSSGIVVSAGGVTAPYFSGSFTGNGAGLSGVTAAGVAAPNVTAGTLGAGVQLPAGSLSPGTLPAGVMLPTSQLTGGTINSALLPASLAYANASNTFAPVQSFPGGLSASSITLTAAGNSQYSLATSSGISVAAGGVTAPFLSGAHYGSGAALTGVTAAAVAAANVAPGTLGAGVQLPAASLAAGILGTGVLLPAANLTAGPIAAALLPGNLAFTTVNNNFTASQTIAGGLAAVTGTFTGAGTTASLATSSSIVVNAGGVTAPYLSGAHVGDGSRLTNVAGTAPIGALFAYAGNVEPPGWIECDGRSIPQNGSASASWGSFNAAALFAAISTQWGSAGAGFFNIPDMRGIFPRGYNHGKTGSYSDPDAGARVAQYASGAAGDAIGTYQTDQLRSHNHGMEYPHTYGLGAGPYPYGAGSATTTNNTGGNETRPTNASVLYIIRVQ